MTKSVDLQDRQKAVYDAIGDYWREHGWGPSYQELTDLCGITSRSLTKTAVDALVERGLVSRVPRIIRSTRIARDWPQEPPKPQLWGLFCHGRHGRIDAVTQEWEMDRSTGSGDRQILRCWQCGGSAGLERIE